MEIQVHQALLKDQADDLADYLVGFFAIFCRLSACFMRNEILGKETPKNYKHVLSTN